MSFSLSLDGSSRRAGLLCLLLCASPLEGLPIKATVAREVAGVPPRYRGFFGSRTEISLLRIHLSGSVLDTDMPYNQAVQLKEYLSAWVRPDLDLFQVQPRPLAAGRLAFPPVIQDMLRNPDDRSFYLFRSKPIEGLKSDFESYAEFVTAIFAARDSALRAECAAKVSSSTSAERRARYELAGAALRSCAATRIWVQSGDEAWATEAGDVSVGKVAAAEQTMARTLEGVDRYNLRALEAAIQAKPGPPEAAQIFAQWVEEFPKGWKGFATQCARGLSNAELLARSRTKTSRSRACHYIVTSRGFRGTGLGGGTCWYRWAISCARLFATWSRQTWQRS